MQDDRIDAALRSAPQVKVPPHFANRVLASLPREAAGKPERAWVLPAVALAGAAVIGSLTWVSVSLGLGRWISQPSVLATLISVEAAASMVWAWRVFRSVR